RAGERVRAGRPERGRPLVPVPWASLRRHLLRRGHRARLQSGRSPRVPQGAAQRRRRAPPIDAEPRLLGESTAPAGGNLAPVPGELVTRQARPAPQGIGTGKHYRRTPSRLYAPRHARPPLPAAAGGARDPFLPSVALPDRRPGLPLLTPPGAGEHLPGPPPRQH